MYFCMVGHSESDNIFVYELRANDNFRMVGKSESDDIFVYELGANELITTRLSIFLSLFELILSRWVPYTNKYFK